MQMWYLTSLWFIFTLLLATPSIFCSIKNKRLLVFRFCHSCVCTTCNIQVCKSRWCFQLKLVLLTLFSCRAVLHAAWKSFSQTLYHVSLVHPHCKTEELLYPMSVANTWATVLPAANPAPVKALYSMTVALYRLSLNLGRWILLIMTVTTTVICVQSYDQWISWVDVNCGYYVVSRSSKTRELLGVASTNSN